MSSSCHACRYGGDYCASSTEHHKREDSERRWKPALVFNPQQQLCEHGAQSEYQRKPSYSQGEHRDPCHVPNTLANAFSPILSEPKCAGISYRFNTTFSVTVWARASSVAVPRRASSHLRKALQIPLKRSV